MGIIYPELPQAIYRDEVFEAVRLLGFELSDVRSIKIERAGIEIVLLPKLENGKRFAASHDEVATITLHLPVSDRVTSRSDVA
jgi:hypothetical protein